ncbi:transporter [Arthrobacter caoxuetaonis]|uniref:Transporter n=1 Tax=Arthrobacter caoxuetaonis TaxID=2886935 RepID=A0A9X1MCN0_9MICC|nr:transporter [Arthrobacter caoxuetaonis]MCC3296900.1 transporter [Arthrobacter caoxuetaonis]USQ56284.1 transporter [Arthrobacter caoxuetaonis]
MVAHLLRLKLILLRNSLRRSPWQIVGIVFGALYGIGILTMLIGALFFLGLTDPALARTAVILGGSAVLLGWGIIPVLATGVDMTLDPARFVTFAIPMRQMLAGLALGSLIGVPGLVTLLASLAQAFSWWQHPAAVLAAVPAALVAVLSCVVLARTTVAATTSLASSRRFKDVAGLVAIVPLVLLGPIFGISATGFAASGDFLFDLAEGLAWTPLGAAWAIPGDIVLGNTGTAAVRFVIAVAFLVFITWAWKALLARALVTPAHNAAARRGAGKLGFFARMPATPAGAVAARALTYWVRDPRYSASLILIPALVAIMVFVGFQGGEGIPPVVLGLGPLVAFLLAFGISADISYDNTAFALHISTGVSGTADRAGRAVACAVFALPATLAAAVLPPVLVGRPEDIPALLGLSVGLLLSGLGLSSVFSARYTYNVPLPGENAFKTPPGSTGRTMLVQFIWMAVQFVIALPLLAPAVAYLFGAGPLWGWVALVVGVLYGAAAMIMGIRIGGRWLDRRAPEVLLAVSVNK